MERELSVFRFLTEQMQGALDEMAAKNYGNAEKILRDALESAQDYELIFPNSTRQ